MKFQNYINGKWVKGKSAFQTINPANEEIVAEIAQAEISDVDAAVSAAAVVEGKVLVSACSWPRVAKWRRNFTGFS